jgi:hypothetical protein
MQRIIYLCITLALLVSCKSNKDPIKDLSKESFILFGTGGGFTGKVTSYKLFETGQIKKQTGINTAFNSHSTIDKKTCIQIFNSIEQLDLKSKPINDPGNLYYFIELNEKGEKTRFTWGGINKEPDSVIRAYYNLLHGLATRKQIAKE